MATRTCEGCGDVIPNGRIEALPDTVVCIDCELKIERHFGVRPRSEADVDVDAADNRDLVRSAQVSDREK